MRWILGVDFDNTIIDYERVMHRAAVRQGLISPDEPRNKKELRDAVRGLPDGELRWQRLQAEVYGPKIWEARLANGTRRFFRQCHERKVVVHIVSHKTEYAHAGDKQVNLRWTALAWMKDRRFFHPKGLGLSPENVFFEETRHRKLERIRKLQCTHFIDDLEETFREAAFPDDVEKILYAPHRHSSLLPRLKVAATWAEIGGYLFNDVD